MKKDEAIIALGRYKEDNYNLERANRELLEDKKRLNNQINGLNIKYERRENYIIDVLKNIIYSIVTKTNPDIEYSKLAKNLRDLEDINRIRRDF